MSETGISEAETQPLRRRSGGKNRQPTARATSFNGRAGAGWRRSRNRRSNGSEKSQERGDAKQEPKAEKSSLDRFRYRGGAGRDRDDGHDLDR